MNRDLLDRFYKGECSDEELQKVLAWFQIENMAPEQEQELQSLWQEADQVKAEEVQPHDAGRVFSKIKGQLEDVLNPEQEKRSTVIDFAQRQQPQFWFKAAAAVLLPLCLIWAFVQYASRDKSDAAVYISVAAAPGVIKTINLPDGSVIRLNAGSEISYLKSFAAEKREILLWGEAFFEVAKDSLRPFIVRTGSISTQALGTSFNINYSSYDDAITVALATGVVKIDKQEQGRNRQLTRLKPGQQLSFSQLSEEYKVSPFKETEVLGWQEGILYFKKANINQIIRKLENVYGVDIEVEPQDTQIETWNYTGEYNNETLEKVLEGIGFVKGFTYRRTDNKVKLIIN